MTYLMVKQQIKHLNKNEYNILKELCHIAKNLKNEAIYNIRQYYFLEEKYLSYSENYKMLKFSENYKLLNSNMAEQILKGVDRSFKSFFGVLKCSKEGKCSYAECKLPQYLPKKGYATLVIGYVRINGNMLLLPYSNKYRKTHKNIVITIPPILKNKKIKEIRIIPKSNARFFEIQYIYEAEIKKRNLDKKNALGLDIGVNNLVTAVSTYGKSFIIDGKRLKSINQWFNKENARLQSIKDKQNFGEDITNRQSIIATKRKNRVNDYMSKAAMQIIEYCCNNNIGTLVVGYNKTFQKNLKFHKKDNQNLVNIPFGVLRKKLQYLCDLNCIDYVEQEESYTSQASFWDKDFIPVYKPGHNKKYVFSGKRVYRGLYITKSGKKMNADVNGALNIIRKSNVVNMDVLYDRGEVDTPVRIRVA